MLAEDVVCLLGHFPVTHVTKLEGDFFEELLRIFLSLFVDKLHNLNLPKYPKSKDIPLSEKFLENFTITHCDSRDQK